MEGKPIPSRTLSTASRDIFGGLSKQRLLHLSKRGFRSIFTKKSPFLKDPSTCDCPVFEVMVFKGLIEGFEVYIWAICDFPHPSWSTKRLLTKPFVGGGGDCYHDELPVLEITATTPGSRLFCLPKVIKQVDVLPCFAIAAPGLLPKVDYARRLRPKGVHFFVAGYTKGERHLLF